MALTVLPQLKNPSRSFVDFLIKRRLIKDGFGPVLGGRDFPEIDEYLLEHNLIEPEELAEQYAAFYNLPFERLINKPILPSVLNLLPGEIALKYVVVPYKLEGSNLYLAVGEPSRLQRNAPSVLTGLHRQKGLQVHLAIVPKSDVEAVLHKSHDHGPLPSTTTPPTVQKIPPPLDISNEVKSLNKQDLIKEVNPRDKQVDLRGQKIPFDLLKKIPLPVATQYQMV